MKLTLLLLLLPVMAGAQKIAEDKTDEFKGTRVIRTDWNKQVEKMSGPVSFVRISKLDSLYVLDFKTAYGAGASGVYSIKQGSELIFKLADETMVTLKSIETVVSEKGGGTIGITASSWYGTQTTYVLTAEQRDQLKKSPAVKYRIYMRDGYNDQDIKEKWQNSISLMLHLIPE